MEHMHKKFEINQTKIKSNCQSGRKVVTYNSKSDLPLVKMERNIPKKIEKICRKKIEKKIETKY